MSEQIKKDFLLPDLKKDGATKYLGQIAKVVKSHYKKNTELRKVHQGKKYTFRIGDFKSTSYKDDPELLDEWEQFYLTDHMKMEVIGVLEKFPCNADSAELVLMVCEDGKVFGFEEERLHLVANSLKELFESGFQFPSKPYYYRGQCFEDMTDSQWEKVKQSKKVMEKAAEHKKMLEGIKNSYLKNLEIIRQKQKGEPKHSEKGRDPYASVPLPTVPVNK